MPLGKDGEHNLLAPGAPGRVSVPPLLPAWQLARETSRATGTPSSWTSRVRGPATPIPGTTSSAPCRRRQFATNHGSGRGPRPAGGGPRTSSTTWSGGPGRRLGCRGRRRSPGLSWPWIMRRLWGGRSQPPPTTGCGVRACCSGTSPNPAQGSGPGRTHLVAGTLLSGAPLGRCRSLLPLWGRVCAGLSARPFFAARHEVMLQLMRLATQCRDSRVQRLRAPARMRPPLSDRFLMDYFPRPLEGGGGGALLPCARRPPRASPRSGSLAAPQRSRPPGADNGTQGALCLEHGAPLCAMC